MKKGEKIKAWAVIINGEIWKSDGNLRIVKTKKQAKREYPEYKPIRVEIRPFEPEIEEVNERLENIEDKLEDLDEAIDGVDTTVTNIEYNIDQKLGEYD